MLRPNWTHYLTGILLIFSVCTGYLSYRQAGQIAVLRTELQQAQEATKKLQATSVFRERKRAATARSDASADARAAAAVASVPEWANTPVPKEIADALAE